MLVPTGNFLQFLTPALSPVGAESTVGYLRIFPSLSPIDSVANAQPEMFSSQAAYSLDLVSTKSCILRRMAEADKVIGKQAPERTPRVAGPASLMGDGRWELAHVFLIGC